MHFKNPEELLEFVLAECGGMEWKYSIEYFQSDGVATLLTIKKGFNLERIYYAYLLLIELFGIKIYRLYLSENHDVQIDDNYLEMMEIKVFSCYDNGTNGCPRLNDSVESALFDSDIFINFIDDDGKTEDYSISGIIDEPNKVGLQLKAISDGLEFGDAIVNEHDDGYYLRMTNSIGNLSRFIYFNGDEEYGKAEDFIHRVFSEKKSKSICDYLEKTVKLKYKNHTW